MTKYFRPDRLYCQIPSKWQMSYYLLHWSKIYSVSRVFSVEQDADPAELTAQLSSIGMLLYIKLACCSTGCSAAFPERFRCLQ